MAAVHGLSNRLLLLIAIALQLPSDFFLQFYDKPMMYLRPLHYSPQVSLPEEVTIRLPLVLQCVGNSSLQISSTAPVFDCISGIRPCQRMVSLKGLVMADPSQLLLNLAVVFMCCLVSTKTATLQVILRQETPLKTATHLFGLIAYKTMCLPAQLCTTAGHLNLCLQGCMWHCDAVTLYARCSMCTSE